MNVWCAALRGRHRADWYDGRLDVQGPLGLGSTAAGAGLPTATARQGQPHGWAPWDMRSMGHALHGTPSTSAAYVVRRHGGVLGSAMVMWQQVMWPYPHALDHGVAGSPRRSR